MYGYILSNDKKSACITKYYGPRDIKKLVIPKGIKSIAKGAFSRRPIDFIEIPASVKYIGGEAFSVTGLENIYFKGDAPEIVRTPFTVKFLNCEFEQYSKVYYKEGKKGFDDNQ